MRTLIGLLAALFIISVPSSPAQGRFYLGAAAGVSRTSLSGDAPEDASYTSKIGFACGFIAEYALSPDIRLSVQPSYARRGTGVGYDIGEEDLRDSLSLSLDYISFPVMARFLSSGGSWFVNGGFDFGFLLDASLEDVNAGSSADVKESINNFDVMMILGVGTSISVAPAFITLELRYGQSLANAGANDQLTATAGVPLRFRSSGFQLLAAVLFPL
jgi:hypothetical protein